VFVAHLCVFDNCSLKTCNTPANSAVVCYTQQQRQQQQQHICLAVGAKYTLGLLESSGTLEYEGKAIGAAVPQHRDPDTLVLVLF
jgi:hypothetical protein